jgi:RNA polymerase sigma factor (sigma-70 family)
MQWGRLGLYRALQDYDPERARFTTYASHWIRSRIRRAIQNESKTVRLPVVIHNARYRLNRYSERQKLLTGRKPTIDEAVDGIEKMAGISKAYIRKTCSCSHASVSIDEPIDGDRTMHDVLHTDSMEPNLDRHTITIAMLKIKPRHRTVLVMRFWEGKTLEETGQRLGVSRERVRQIQADAIEDLRDALGLTG